MPSSSASPSGAVSSAFNGASSALHGAVASALSLSSSTGGVSTQQLLNSASANLQLLAAAGQSGQSSLIIVYPFSFAPN